MKTVVRPLAAGLLALSLLGVVAGGIASAADAPAKPAGTVKSEPKVLRYAFRIAETGFDPAQLSDIYSRTITSHIFEALYEYDPLARPAKLRPLTAVAMPEHSDDFRVWTVKVQPGIFFADDPAFKGKKRELVAEDYAFTFKRFADPAVKSPAWSSLENFGLLGLNELRQQALKDKKPFDYDKPIAGLKVLDRYTIQFRVKEPSPRFVGSALASSDLTGAMAREVAQAYGDTLPAHPVGTGPFKLAQWRRSSFIALERNPDFRPMTYTAEPAPGDAEGQAILALMQGKRVPMIDRVEISIIEENQPRWLTFVRGDSDLIEEVPPEYMDRVMPGGKIAPNLAKQGLRGYRMVRSDSALTFYNMDDPVVGGYTPDKVALRRAINLAVDVEREILLARYGQAIVAHSPIVPNTNDYDASFRSENGEFNPARSKALLDMYGYVDKDGDGWRDMPDGSPLLLHKATQPDQQSRALDEQWRRNMAAIKVKMVFETAKWPENLKAARAGKLQMWGVGSLASEPDSQGAFERLNSRQVGGGNLARFRLPEMDAIFDKLSMLPDGPERSALFKQANRLAVAYAPYKVHVHRYINDMAQPWVLGYRRPLFWLDYWQYIDIDNSKRPAH